MPIQISQQWTAASMVLTRLSILQELMYPRVLSNNVPSTSTNPNPNPNFTNLCVFCVIYILHDQAGNLSPCLGRSYSLCKLLKVSIHTHAHIIYITDVMVRNKRPLRDKVNDLEWQLHNITREV